MTTLEAYRTTREHCQQIFIKKNKDYGTSWRVLRPISIVDQIYIKAWRIRSIQEAGGVQLIKEPIEDEFRAIINYGYMALIQLELDSGELEDPSPEELLRLYDAAAQSVENLMLKKNHDYGEAWREMSQASFVDLILTKLLRIKQILANKGKTLISEGVDANFMDLINYAFFALIQPQVSD